MTKRDAVSVETLKRIVSYNPNTGTFTHNHRPIEMFNGPRAAVMAKAWNSRFAGRPAGKVSGGYLYISFLRFEMRAHRVAWAITNGKWPDGLIDHVNGNPLDNKIENLRCVSQSENMMNTARPVTNTSGCVGVCWAKREKKWMAFIKIGGVQKSLGYFDEIESAIAARKAAEIEHGFHANHGREALAKRGGRIVFDEEKAGE